MAVYEFWFYKIDYQHCRQFNPIYYHQMKDNTLFHNNYFIFSIQHFFHLLLVCNEKVIIIIIIVLFMETFFKKCGYVM